MKKRVRIFAAFDKDVEEDVVRFGDFLCGLNAQHTGVELSVFKSEKELCESLEQTTEQIDGELDACEYFLLILGNKNDEFALDKLNRALEHYARNHGNPDIHIFVNAANKGADEVISYFSSEEYEHYVEQFKHNDTLKAKFLIWLSAKQKDFSYETDTDIHGTPVIKVSGRPVTSLVDFDALLNNEDYQDQKKKLLKKRSQREKYRKEALDAEGGERDDLWDEISALAKEIDVLQNEIAARERDTLALYQNYAKMTLESGYSARHKRALECIERGELDRARRVLDPEGSLSNLAAIENENKMLAARMETNKKIAEQEVNILFAEINRLKLDTGNKNRFDEIEKCYANIEYFQEKLGLEMTVLFDYAKFLADQNKHNASIGKFAQELARCRKLAETNPDEYLPNVARALNGLANVQKATNHYTEAETNYIEALAIRRKLAESNLDEHLSDTAKTLNNLAFLQTKANRYKEAETNYSESLEINRKLAKSNHDEYLSGLAATLHNFGIALYNNCQYKEADANYTEALVIRRKLVETNPCVYLSGLADVLICLALLQANTSRYKEAETNYMEALEIKRKLAETNQSAYLSGVADVLHNLALLQDNIKRYTEAEANYIEALSIYRKLAGINPDVYLSYVAQTLNNLAIILKNTNRYIKAETNYNESLEIRRKLAETNPNVYEPDVAQTLNNLANLQAGTNRYTEAEANYTEAIKIFTDLFSKNSEKYQDTLTKVFKNLIELKEKLSKTEEVEDLKNRLKELKSGL